MSFAKVCHFVLKDDGRGANTVSRGAGCCLVICGWRKERSFLLYLRSCGKKGGWIEGEILDPAWQGGID